MKIKISYTTGSSFEVSREEGYVDLEWDNIEKAKESLKRIENHYEYYQKNNDLWKKPKGELPMGVVWNNEYRLIELELITDNNEPYLYSSFWTGYFETLHYAEIVNGKDMIYEPNGYEV